MTNRQRPAKEQQKHRRQRRAKPVAAQPANERAGQIGLAELPDAPIPVAGNDSSKAQAARLGDVQLQTVQRQALAAQIGWVQGNHHLQRVLSSIQCVGETEPSRAVPGLSQETVETARGHLESNRQEAINVVVQSLVDQGRINLSYIADEIVRYDPDLPPGQYGGTSETGRGGPGRPSRVSIGPAAFRNVSVLYTTIMHEYQHVLQRWERGEGEEAVEEVEAYLWEIENLENTGAWRDGQYMHRIAGDLRTWWGRLEPEQRTPLQDRHDRAQDTLTEMEGRLWRYQLDVQHRRIEPIL